MEDFLDCSDVADRLPLYVGGDLEPDAEARVTEHIARCPACAEQEGRSSLARRVLVGALWESATAGETRSELWPGIRARLAEEGLLGGAAAPGPITPALPSLAEGPGSVAATHAPATPGAAPDRRGTILSMPGRAWRAAALVAAAACLLLLIDRLGNDGGVQPRLASPGAVPMTVPLVQVQHAPAPTFEVPAATSIGPADPTFAGGLRRVGLEDGRLADEAAPRRPERSWPVFTTPRSSGESLAGYR